MLILSVPFFFFFKLEREKGSQTGVPDIPRYLQVEAWRGEATQSMCVEASGSLGLAQPPLPALRAPLGSLQGHPGAPLVRPGLLLVLGLPLRADFCTQPLPPRQQLLSFSFRQECEGPAPWVLETVGATLALLGTEAPGTLGPQLRGCTLHALCLPFPQPEAALARKASQIALLGTPPTPPFPSPLPALSGHLLRPRGSLQVPPPTPTPIWETAPPPSIPGRSLLASICAKNL